MTTTRRERHTRDCHSLSAPTDIYVMQRLASTLQAKRFSQSEGQCFRLLVVATYKDGVPQGELPARVKAFDQVLRNILLPACEKELISFSASQIPFVLNLKEPDGDDLKRLDIIRSEVGKSEEGEVVRTPGAFLVFEQELMELAKIKDPTGGILSLSECRAIGARLKMKQEDVEAALIFFDRQFTLLYILPQTPPQPCLHEAPNTTRLYQCRRSVQLQGGLWGSHGNHTEARFISKRWHYHGENPRVQGANAVLCPQPL